MTNTALAPDTAFRYIGVTDECVECQRCGRADLRSTVVLAILDADGNDTDVTYYGSTCAARALALGRGGARRVTDAARAAHRRTLDEAADARHMLAARGWTVDVAPAGTDLDVWAWKARRHAYDRSPWNVFRDRDDRGWAGWRADVVDAHARWAAAIRAAALVGRAA